MADELLADSEIGLAFIIVGILLFVIEVFQPGFLIAVPGTCIHSVRSFDVF